MPDQRRLKDCDKATREIKSHFQDIVVALTLLEDKITKRNAMLTDLAIEGLKESGSGWCTNCKDLKPPAELSLIYIEGVRLISKGETKDLSQLHQVCPPCRKHAVEFNPKGSSRWQRWQVLDAFEVHQDGKRVIRKEGLQPIPPHTPCMFDSQHVPTKVFWRLGLPYLLTMTYPELNEMVPERMKKFKLGAAKTAGHSS